MALTAAQRREIVKQYCDALVTATDPYAVTDFVMLTKAEQVARVKQWAQAEAAARRAQQQEVAARVQTAEQRLGAEAQALDEF